MRIALLAPLPPEQNGIADYAGHFKAALEACGVEVLTPLAGCDAEPESIYSRLQACDWSQIDLVHAEIGGGRLREFIGLEWLRRHYPKLILTATVHDPERLIWRPQHLPWFARWTQALPALFQQAAVVACDPLTLRSERQLAQGLNRLFTLTGLGAQGLSRRMQLSKGQVAVVPHGNLTIAPAPLPDLDVLRLLYFGFIYRGKGIETLLMALACVFEQEPALKPSVRLTLAGGTAAQMAFGGHDSYLDELKALIARLGLSANVDWQLNLPSSEIASTIQQHHVMVLPYRESKKLSILGEQRGTSGALSWAAACGRGAITSTARAFAEEVSQGNGITFNQGDTQALTQALLTLIRQPSLAASWGECASQIGRERQWPQIARQFHQHFQDLRQGA